MNEKPNYAKKAYDGWKSTLDRVFDGKTVKERTLFFAVLAVSAIISVIFSFARLPYTSLSAGLPLADAFLCASGPSLPGAFLGAVYAAFISGSRSVFRYLSLLTVFFLRLAGGLWLKGNDKVKGIFREPPQMKLGYAALLVLMQSAMHFAKNGMTETILYELLGTLLACPLLTALFLPFFEGCPVKSIGRSNFMPRAMYEISALILFSVLCYTSAQIRYAGCSLGVLFGLFLTMVCAKRGGFIRGAITGCLLGLVTLPSYTVSFVVLGTLFGIFAVLGSFPAAGISAFCASAVAVFGVGFEAFITFVPQIIIAVAIASPVIKYSFLPARFPYPQYGNPDELEAITAAEMRAMEILDRKEQLYRLAGAFRELSETLKNVERESPSAALSDADRITHHIRSAVCSSCPLEPICWISETPKTSESFRKMILYPESVKTGDYVYTHCIHLSDVKRESERLKKRYGTATEKIPELPFGHEYGAVSEILYDIAALTENEYLPDKDAESAVYRAAFALGFRPDLISVVGDREKRIYAYGVTPEKASASGEKIRAAFSAACKVEFAPPQFQNEAGGCMIFCQAERYKCDSVCITSPKDGESISGDSALSFGTPEGKYYSLITDGMGSGSEAFESSRLTCGVLEKLLRCGVRRSIAVKLAGDIIFMRGNEVFSTVDLAEIDLITGKASFVKSGAAASYVIRNSAVYCISANALPIGITKEATPEEVTFDLIAGDRIVMVSDGVLSDSDESSWLSTIVSENITDNGALASKIMEKAVSIGGRKDDMTVTVISVLEKDRPSAENAA